MLSLTQQGDAIHCVGLSAQPGLSDAKFTQPRGRATVVSQRSHSCLEILPGRCCTQPRSKSSGPEIPLLRAQRLCPETAPESACDPLRNNLKRAAAQARKVKEKTARRRHLSHACSVNQRFRASRVRRSRTAGLAGVTMYPVSGSPISKDSLRGLSRQRSAISTHNTESILSWSAFCGWSILPASRHHPAISSQPSAWKPCAAASATRGQSSLRKVFLRSVLYFGPASRPKNPESRSLSE